MFNIVKQVLNFQDNLYIVERIIKEEDIKEEHVQEYKEYIHADIVLKKNSIYYFVNKIQDAEIIPETGQLKLDF
jgi:hypothetical protein